MKVYILGCAKTGTTLLLKMFHAIDGVEVLDQDFTEISLEDFIKLPDPGPGKILVGKRTRATLMSNDLPPWLVAQQAQMILDNDIKTLYCTRDRSEVMKNDRVSNERFTASEDQYHEHQEKLKTIKVDYTQMLLKPDILQFRICVCLDIKYKWPHFSMYPSFIPEGRHTPKGANYKLRPLGHLK